MLPQDFSLATLACWISGFMSIVEGSNIGVFTDDSCQTSLRNLNGPNGYPDGSCTPLNINETQSFQVVGLDPGCAVTIYGRNGASGNICSSETTIVAEIATCYNSAWLYYSIDGCDKPEPTPSATSKPDNESEENGGSSSGPNIGAIVGGVVGGLAALGLLLGGLIFLRKRNRNNKQLPPLPQYELGEPAYQPVTTRFGEKRTGTELYAQEAAVEIGPSPNDQPPAELPGHAAEPKDSKGVPSTSVRK